MEKRKEMKEIKRRRRGRDRGRGERGREKDIKRDGEKEMKEKDI